MTDLRYVWRFYVLAHEGKCVRFAGLSCVKAGGCQQPLWFAVMYVRTDVYSQFMYLYQGQYRTSCSQPRKLKTPCQRDWPSMEPMGIVASYASCAS